MPFNLSKIWFHSCEHLPHLCLSDPLLTLSCTQRLLYLCTFLQLLYQNSLKSPATHTHRHTQQEKPVALFPFLEKERGLEIMTPEGSRYLNYFRRLMLRPIKSVSFLNNMHLVSTHMKERFQFLDINRIIWRVNGDLF